MSTIAVDFDNVITRYTGWSEGEIADEPFPGAIPSLKILMELASVYILTCRGPQFVALWFAEHAPEIDVVAESTILADGSLWWDSFERTFWNERGSLLVTRRKLPALVYLDDRALRFEGSWPKAILETGNLIGHHEAQQKIRADGKHRQS